MLMVIELYPDGETAAEPLDGFKRLANEVGFDVISSPSYESAVRRIELNGPLPLERRTFLALVDEVPEG